MFGKKYSVFCPGCGRKMSVTKPHLYVGNTKESPAYICSFHCAHYLCGWDAPVGSGKTKEEALENAFQKASIRAVSIVTEEAM
mgnify:CR=1 FL=1